jgi:hypothetical protein
VEEDDEDEELPHPEEEEDEDEEDDEEENEEDEERKIEEDVELSFFRERNGPNNWSVPSPTQLVQTPAQLTNNPAKRKNPFKNTFSMSKRTAETKSTPSTTRYGVHSKSIGFLQVVRSSIRKRNYSHNPSRIASTTRNARPPKKSTRHRKGRCLKTGRLGKMNTRRF